MMICYTFMRYRPAGTRTRETCDIRLQPPESSGQSRVTIYARQNN